MELLAVSETSRRSLLPARFQSLSIDDIQTRLRSARQRALGRCPFPPDPKELP
jgi:transitional endoplasmic reticulum ATPase